MRLDAAHKGGPGVSGGDGDLGELVGGRVDVEAAVGEDQRTVGAELRGVGAHHEEGRDQLGTRGGLKDLQRGAQGVGGGVAGAGDQAVGVTHLDHHGAKVGGVHHLGASLLDGDALLGAELGKLLRVLLVLLGIARIDDGGAGNVDLVGVAQDDDLCQALLDDLGGRDDGARILALGQDDRLKVGLGGRLHTVKEIAHVTPYKRFTKLQAPGCSRINPLLAGLPFNYVRRGA